VGACYEQDLPGASVSVVFATSDDEPAFARLRRPFFLTRSLLVFVAGGGSKPNRLHIFPVFAGACLSCCLSDRTYSPCLFWGTSECAVALVVLVGWVRRQAQSSCLSTRVVCRDICCGALVSAVSDLFESRLACLFFFSYPASSGGRGQVLALFFFRTCVGGFWWSAIVCTSGGSENWGVGECSLVVAT